MSIIGIDIGSSTTKIVSFKENKIIHKKIFRKTYENSMFKDFVTENKINDIEKIVFTGIGADNVDINEYQYSVEKVDEFTAIANGGLCLSGKDKAIVVSVGTGTALIEATSQEIKHLGGTGVGAGTLFNVCEHWLGINNFDDIYNLTQKGDIGKIDLRIGDVTEQEIETLPKDLTLSNFGKFENSSKKEDFVFGLVNMIFEVIGMMVAFYSINSEIKEAILIGNIVVLPRVKEILKKIECTHKIKFIIPDNAEFGVVLGAIKSSEK